MANENGGHIAAAVTLIESLLLLETGCDLRSQTFQHLFGAIGVGSARLQFQILVEVIHGSRRRHHLALLIDGGFLQRVDGALIIGIGLIGIGLNGLGEGGIGVIGFAGISENGALVVVGLGSVKRVLIAFFTVGVHGFGNLFRFGISLAKIIVVLGHHLLGVGAGLCRSDLNCLI